MGWKGVNNNNVTEVKNPAMEPVFAWLAGFPLLPQHFAFFCICFLLKLVSSPAQILADSVAGGKPRCCFFCLRTFVCCLQAENLRQRLFLPHPPIPPPLEVSVWSLGCWRAMDRGPRASRLAGCPASKASAVAWPWRLPFASWKGVAGQLLGCGRQRNKLILLTKASVAHYRKGGSKNVAKM